MFAETVEGAEIHESLMASSRDQQHDPLYETVLVLTDGSGRARRLAEWALVFAGASGNTVHRVDVLDCLDSGVVIQTDGKSVQKEDEHQERTHTRAAPDGMMSQNQGHATAIDVLHGVPSEALLDYLRANAIDFTIMCICDNACLNRTLLGRTFARVSQATIVPMMTITGTNDPHNPRCEIGHVAIERSHPSETR